MAKKPTITTITTSPYNLSALNANFEDLRDAFENTLSLDGSTPNAMNADLDLNNNNLMNVNQVSATDISVGGTSLATQVSNAAASAAASASSASDSASSAADSAASAVDSAASAAESAASAVLADARADDAASFAGYRDFKDLATLLANSSLTYSDVSAGDIIRTREEGFSYEVAASGASDNHVATAGGVKLYARPGDSDYNVKAFGAVGDGVTDDTAAINLALNSVVDYGSVYFPQDTFLVNGIGADKVSMTGRAKLVAAAGASEVVKLGRETDGFWYREVNGLAVDGNGSADGFAMEDISGSSNTRAGRWVLDKVRIDNCAKGIVKPYGNISNAYKHISLRNCEFGYWARGRTSSDPDFDISMHAGCDIFEQGRYSGVSKAVFYIDDTAENGGQHIWNECIIEGNTGFGIFVKNHLAQNLPIAVNNTWFENNGVAGTVTIDGVNYTGGDMYFENTSLVEINGCKFKRLELVNSAAVLDRSFGNANTEIVVDNTSSVRITNALLDDYKPGPEVIIESVANAYRSSGSQATVFATTPRLKISGSTFSGNVVLSDNGSTPVTFTGTSSVLTTSQTDGLSYTTCQELVQPASHTALHPTVFAITNGKFYVTIAELKRAATDLQTIQFQDATVLCSNLQTPARSGEWSTIASVSQAATTANVRLRVRNDDPSPATLRYGALQVVEFDSYSDALSFFNSRLLVA